MSIVMYERVGFEGRRPSPFSWRTRLALAHKEIPVEFVPVRFADEGTIVKLSDQRFVPIVVDGDRVISDSWNIAVYLEATYPARPSLFGGSGGEKVSRLVNIWSDTSLHPPLRRIMFADFLWCLDPGDRAYFRKSREAEFGMSLEEACSSPGKWLELFEGACAPLEKTLGEQAFLGGESPLYSDYVVFSVFQWARLGCPTEVVRSGSALWRWRERMLSLFNGVADAFPGYPKERTGTDGR
jgi:glutathione S-transferase